MKTEYRPKRASIKGGSWFDATFNTKSANRDSLILDLCFDNTGLRIILRKIK